MERNDLPTFILEKPYDCDALVLAGDIGDPFSITYSQFIQQAASMYKYIFLIKGNHECYNSTVKDTIAKITQICDAYPNVFFLDRETFYDIGDTIRVCGVTLWSHIQQNDIHKRVLDFTRIKDWNIEKHNHEHCLDVCFLQHQIQNAASTNKRLVVITHHAPYTIGTSHPDHEKSTITSAYSTDLSYLIKAPIIAWIYGHTHFSQHQIINGVHLLSNQRGTRRECACEFSRFDPLFTISV
jgi:predicted phosphodiesterase